MSTTLVRHQALGLGVALLLILGVMAIQFRSIRLGLLCAIPNGAPVLAVYGLMGWSGIALSVPTAMIASVAIGTIVDNSIYLLARFREAFAQQPDYVEALIAMVYASGRAVVFSTLTLAVGFFVGVFSSFVPTVQFGLLTGAAFLLGLISQFVLLPLSLVLFQPLGRCGGRTRSARSGHGRAGDWRDGRPRAGPGDSGQPCPQGSVRQCGRAPTPSGPGRALDHGKVEGMRRMKAWEESLRDKVPGTLVVLRGLDAREAQGKKTKPRSTSAFS
jgi:hypothetical protein